MTDHQLDRRIRTAYPTPPPSAVDEQTWQQIVSNLHAAPDEAAPARRRRRPARVALIAAALLVIISGVAIAAEPELLKRIFPQGSAADRMEALKTPAELAPAVDPEDLTEIKMILGHAGRQVLEDPLDFDATRLLLQHEDGPVSVALYAIPTDSGSICHFWRSTIGGGGGCSETTFRTGHEIAHSASHFGTKDGWETVTSIEGLTTDKVTHVRIRMDDDSVQDTITGENAFFWYPRPYVDMYPYAASPRPQDMPPPHEAEPVTLLIDLTDGSTVEEPVR